MIRRLFKWTFRLVVLVAILVVAVAFGRNTFVRLLLERRLQAATGFETTVGRARVDWVRPKIQLSHVRLFHPESLGGKPFLEIPQATITYDFTELFSRRFHVTELEATVAEILFVRRGATAGTQALLARYRTNAVPIPAFLVDPLDFVGVDRLILSADRYTYMDYQDMTQSQTVRLGLREVTVSQVTRPGDWIQLWRHLARSRGVIPPPLPGVTPVVDAPVRVPVPATTAPAPGRTTNVVQ